MAVLSVVVVISLQGYGVAAAPASAGRLSALGAVHAEAGSNPVVVNGEEAEGEGGQLGATPEAPSPRAALTGSERRLAFLTPWPRLAIVVAFLVALAVVGLTAWNLHRSRRTHKAVLLSLRCLVVMVALYLFLEPAVQEYSVTRVRNNLVVLADASMSMTIADRQGGPTRLDQMRNFILATGDEGWRDLAKDHVISVYRFADDLSPASLSAIGEDEDWASGTRTDIAGAMDEISRRYRDRDLAGVLLLSDGADNGGLGLRTPLGGAVPEDIRRGLEALGAPVNAILLGESAGLRDLSVHSVQADSFAFVRNVVEVNATIRARGFGSRDIPITLRESGRSVQTRVVRLTPASRDYQVTFSFAPDQVGTHVYTVEAPVLEGESLVDNNKLHFIINVVRDRIRVLQVCGQPSWDQRFLRNHLKSNPGVDLVSFFILRTSANMAMVSNHELSLIPFPTNELFEEELGSFDLVILQNFNFGPYQIGRYLNHLKEYVAKGGGFAMVGGRLSFSGGGYAGTAVEQVLPVELPSRGPDSSTIIGEPYEIRPTADGLRHPVTRFGGGRSAGTGAAAAGSTWQDMGSMAGLNRVTRVRPGATVLLEGVVTPRALRRVHNSPAWGDGSGAGRGASPSRAGRSATGSTHPLVVAGTHGKGRVLSVLTDSMWKLAFSSPDRATPRYYHQFWDDALRWLIRDPELGTASIEPLTSPLGASDTPRFRVVLRDDSHQPSAGEKFRATLHPMRSESGFVEEGVQKVEGETGEDGEALVEFDPVAWGAWRVRVTREDGAGEEGERERAFLVDGPGAELSDPAVREDLMMAIARHTGGVYGGPRTELSELRTLEPKVLRSDRRTSRDLWANPLLLLIVLGLMGVEWAVRRRLGYL